MVSGPPTAQAKKRDQHTCAKDRSDVELRLKRYRDKDERKRAQNTSATPSGWRLESYATKLCVRGTV
jgi:hypothetical protein